MSAAEGRVSRASTTKAPGASQGRDQVRKTRGDHLRAGGGSFQRRWPRWSFREDAETGCRGIGDVDEP